MVFIYNNEEVEIVDSFSHLGLLMHFNGKFNIIQKHIVDLAKKSVFLLLKEITKYNFSINTLMGLFDVYFGPTVFLGAM